jgi:hypothetical protein
MSYFFTVSRLCLFLTFNYIPAISFIILQFTFHIIPIAISSDFRHVFAEADAVVCAPFLDIHLTLTKLLILTLLD